MDAMRIRADALARDLRSSLPDPARTESSVLLLFQTAFSQMNGAQAVLISLAAVLLGAAAGTRLDVPLLACACTAPIPVLLLFHTCVLHTNEPMRELEATLWLRYDQMVMARAALASLCSLPALLILSFLLSRTTGEGMLRLACAGTVPGLLFCVVMLLLTRRPGPADSAGIVSVVLWLLLCLFGPVLELNERLALCPTGGYLCLTVILGLCYGVLLYLTGKGRVLCAVRTV